jgi:hypothetical protein
MEHIEALARAIDKECFDPKWLCKDTDPYFRVMCLKMRRRRDRAYQEAHNIVALVTKLTPKQLQSLSEWIEKKNNAHPIPEGHHENGPAE